MVSPFVIKEYPTASPYWMWKKIQECGKVLPNIDFCVRLADYYGVSLDELVGRDFIGQSTISVRPENQSK